MTGNKNKKLKAYTLIEVLISVTLFTVIMLSATQIFKSVVDGQRGAIAAQNVEESLKYFSEVTGKEMRMAQKNTDGACSSLGIPTTKIFLATTNASSDTLSFKNHYGQCVTYQLGADASGTPRFKIQRNADLDFISPAKIKIDSLHFRVSDASSTQPIVTVNLSAHALDQAQFQSALVIQTSISSRYYK